MIYIKQSYVSKRAALLLTPWEMIITTPVRSLLPPPWEDLPYQALPMNCIMPKVDGVKIHGSSRRYGTCIYIHHAIVSYSALTIFSLDSSIRIPFKLSWFVFYVWMYSFYLLSCVSYISIIFLPQKKTCIKHMISFFFLCQSSYIIYKFIYYRAHSAGDVFSIVCQSHTQVSSGDWCETNIILDLGPYLIIIYSMSLW